MKQTKESKCISCEFKKEKNSDYGILYQWFVKFENGDNGFISTKKKEEPFAINAVVKYEIEEKEFKKNNGDSFKYNAVSKPKDQRSFERRDDSKERIRAYSLIIAKEMVLNGLVALTDDDNAKGVKIESKMMIAANKLRDRMLEALDKKGKENVFVIMNSMEVALEFAKLRKDAGMLVDDFNKFIEI